MILNAVVCVALASNPWTAPRTSAFGSGSDWVLVDVHTLGTRRLSLPNGYQAVRLVASPAGKLIVFTGNNDTSKPNRLFVWQSDQGTEPVSLLPDEKFAGDATIGPDEKIYFVSNTTGPPGQHAAMDYAQLFRITPKGEDLEQLTTGAGCHMLPGIAATRLFYVHTSCHGAKWIEWMSPGSREPKRFPGEAPLVDLATSPDGRFVLTDFSMAGETTVMRGDANDGRLTTLFRFKSNSPISRVQFGRRASDVLFQDETNVWIKSGDGEAKTIVALHKEDAP